MRPRSVLMRHLTSEDKVFMSRAAHGGHMTHLLHVSDVTRVYLSCAKEWNEAPMPPRLCRRRGAGKLRGCVPKR